MSLLTGRTLKFPAFPDNSGTLPSVTGDELISQAILDLLETRQGERVMLPDYGIPDFVFSVVDGGFQARLQYYLQEQILKYIPEIESCEVSSTLDDDGRTAVLVRCYQRGQSDSPRNLVFPVWQYLPQ